MSRYQPTPEEIASLVAEGWRADAEGWWWPLGECGSGRTYREARKEQDRRRARGESGGGRER